VSRDLARFEAVQVGRLLLASFREDALRCGRGWIGDDRRYVGDSRANELMPFRLAVWRKLACLRITRSSWLFNIESDVDRLGAYYYLRAECRV
jgi:hypothetical protein